MDSKYKAYAPKATCIAGDPPRFHFSMQVAGHQFGPSTPGPDLRYIPDEKGDMLTYGEAYKEFVSRNFSAEAYQVYMDWRGLDYIILYPTTGLFATAVPGLDPKAAAAIRRAYNDWVYDFCNEGGGKLLGVGSLDLRDVDLAVQEARRCVTELGLKTLYVLPDPPLDGIPLNHSYYDPLWAEMAQLGVPLGIHESTGHLLDPVGASQVKGSGISYAVKAVSFGLGAMVGALVVTGGGICERHPDLKVVFTESSCWVGGHLAMVPGRAVGAGDGGPPGASASQLTTSSASATSRRSRKSLPSSTSSMPRATTTSSTTPISPIPRRPR